MARALVTGLLLLAVGVLMEDVEGVPNDPNAIQTPHQRMVRAVPLAREECDSNDE